MFVRLSRTIFRSATRCPSTSVPLSVVRVSRRTMSTTSPAKSSDTPWMIGSLLIFGPLFLYLLSPSARKNLHGVHNDHHDFPALKQHEGHHAPETEAPVATAVEIMKDDEGTEANVASSIALSQESDVPNDSTSPEAEAETETLAAVKIEEVPASEEPAATQEAQASEGTPEVKEKSREKGKQDPKVASKA